MEFLKRLFATLFAWRVALVLIAVVGYFLLPERYQPVPFIGNVFQTNFLFWSWANFDGEHYLSIARTGYRIMGEFPQYAFFPLFPLLIKLVNLVVRDYYLAGMLVVHVSTLGFFYILGRWLKELQVRSIWKVIISLLIFPSSFFLVSVYTESVFIFLAITTFYLTEKKQWLPAALVAGLASATRINGLIVTVYFLWKYLRDRKHLDFRSIMVSASSLAGIVGYMVYLWVTTGNPLSFYLAQEAWGKAQPTSPLTTLVAYGRALSVEFIPDLTHLVVAIEVVTLLFIILLLVKSWKLLPREYWYYSLANLALPLATGSLGSLPRFTLTMFPLFVVLPQLGKKSYWFVLLIFFILQIIGVILFTRGYWYA